MICLQVADDRLDGFSALEIFFVFIRQTLEFATVLDVDVGVGLVHPPVAQVNDGLVRFGVHGLHEDAGLFRLLTERVPLDKGMEAFFNREQRPASRWCMRLGWRGNWRS